jgi:hypothetical protein
MTDPADMSEPTPERHPTFREHFARALEIGLRTQWPHLRFEVHIPEPEDGSDGNPFRERRERTRAELADAEGRSE